MKNILNNKEFSRYRTNLINIGVSLAIAISTSLIGVLTTFTSFISHHTTVPIAGAAFLIIGIIALSYLIYNLLLLTKKIIQSTTELTSFVNKVKDDVTTANRKDVTDD